MSMSRSMSMSLSLFSSFSFSLSLFFSLSSSSLVLFLILVLDLVYVLALVVVDAIPSDDDEEGDGQIDDEERARRLSGDASYPGRGELYRDASRSSRIASKCWSASEGSTSVASAEARRGSKVQDDHPEDEVLVVLVDG